MKFIPLTLMLALFSCAPFSTTVTAQSKAQPPTAVSSLTTAQKNTIGKKIWQNECAGSIDGLTTWNHGEEFPSLGIGHFIWYTAAHKGPFTESWPQFMTYCKQRGVSPPAIGLLPHCPWNSSTEFKSKFRSTSMNQLREWLAANVALQTDFIIARSHATLPKILSAAVPSDRARITENYNKVASTPNGQYALIDYVNFKGDGLNPTERYNSKGWGLLQVLGGMEYVASGQPAAIEFSASAKRALSRRITNSPPARGEARWRAGWLSRCDTYSRSL